MFRPFRREVRQTFFQSVIAPVLPTAIFAFSFYLFYCCFGDYMKLSQSAGWKVAPATLTSVEAPPYWRNQWEAQTVFFKNAAFLYSYSVDGAKYAGELQLKPQGPRFYTDAAAFANSGDSVTMNSISQHYEKSYTFAPIGGWSHKRTPAEIAEPFRFDSLGNDRTLMVRYDPAHPASSVLADVLHEHQQRILPWAAGSLALGLLLLFGSLLMKSAQADSESNAAGIDAMYDRLNPGHHI